MSNKVKNLFDLQTNIIRNCILTNMLKFFLTPTQEGLHLYDTIIPTKSITRTEIRKAGKSIPNTFRYELWIRIFDNKLSIILKPKKYSEIEIYNLLLTVSLTSIPSLKNIIKILTANYHPIPTKIDKEFSYYQLNYLIIPFVSIAFV